MAIYPKIQANDGGRQMIDVFGGLNRAMKIREGEWQETMNLSSDEYPLLMTRKRRSLVTRYEGHVLAMLAKAKLAVLTTQFESGDDATYTVKLHYGDEVVMTFQCAQQKLPSCMVSFGAYIIVPGTNVWYNTADGTHGSIDAETKAPQTDITAAGMTHPYVMKVCPCDKDGSPVLIATLVSEEDAKKIESGEMSRPVSSGECYAIGSQRLIRRYLPDEKEQWQTVEHYIRIEAEGIDDGIEVGDYVTISGVNTKWESGNGVYVEDIAYEELDPTHQVYGNTEEKYDDDVNGNREVIAKGEGYLVLKGVFFTRWVTISAEAAASVSAGRRMPDMDFVVEAQNRLWGCKYGVVDGELVNEIYASALGDFKNWRKYDGTSMASWAASVGTDGAWTGAISYQGKPHFFKEKHLHKVYPSAYGGHQIADTQLNGVQDGCRFSLFQMDGSLFYMSRDGVCVYDGSYPRIISNALGDTVCYKAFFGGAKRKLYALMIEDDGNFGKLDQLYVYDLRNGIWNKETAAVPYGIGDGAEFASVGECLYFCGKTYRVPAAYKESTTLWDIHGYEGEAETDVSFRCTSGLIGYADAEQKYITRFVLRLYLAQGASMKVYIEYDSSGTFEQQAELTGTGTGSVVIPVRPRRCDHFRIRMSGVGQMALYSFQKIYKRESDVV